MEKNNKYLLFITITSIVMMQCAPAPKISYNIPADYPEGRRKQLIEIFEKGKELYKDNCSQCHGIFSKGKDSIPNFTQVQFDNYSAKFLSGDPLNHAVARKMTQLQLNQILIFLRYRKTNTAAAKKA